jgi:hypothetical protein
LTPASREWALARAEAALDHAPLKANSKLASATTIANRCRGA